MSQGKDLRGRAVSVRLRLSSSKGYIFVPNIQNAFERLVILVLLRRPVLSTGGLLSPSCSRRKNSHSRYTQADSFRTR